MKMISEESELKALMVRGLDGDAAAYRILLVAMQDHLLSFFTRRLAGDRSRAEDLTQETLMAIHAKRDTFDPGQRFTAWAFALARYKLIDHYRRAKVRRHEPLDDEHDLFEAPCGHDAAIARADLERLMAVLPARQASAIAMTRIEGLTMAEAAARMGASESAVKVSVHRGLKAIRARLKLDTGLSHE
jgi:RNA polymerase sigma-70 factor (ECF subfamily)